MAKTEDKTINENQYKLMLLNPMQQVLFAAKAGQCLAPILSSDKFSIKDIQEKIAKDKEGLIGLLSGVLPDIDMDQLHKLACESMLGNLWVGKVKLNNINELNKHLESSPKDAFPLMLWAVGANVTVFFE